MTNEFKKSSNEKIWYPVGNFEQCLADNETISSFTVNVFDDTGINVTSTIIEAGSPGTQGKRIIAKVTGGADRKTYKCRTKCVTSAGNEFEAIGNIVIID